MCVDAGTHRRAADRHVLLQPLPRTLGADDRAEVEALELRVGSAGFKM